MNELLVLFKLYGILVACVVYSAIWEMVIYDEINNKGKMLWIVLNLLFVFIFCIR